MLTEEGREFVYDKDGNLVQGYTKEGFVFTATYDAEDRLSTISYTDNENVLHKTVYTYRYDSFLVKIAKYENNALTEETRIVRAGFLELQDWDQNNAVVREYTWGLNLGGGIGGLVNIRQNGENFHPLYDGKGSIIALLDSTGAVAAQYRYDTFGRLTAKTGTLDQPFGFSTKRTDSDLGLVYYGYRFYSPDLERWMNRDPLGEEGGINLYGFVGNNPVNWVDPWGLASLTVYVRKSGPGSSGSWDDSGHGFVGVQYDNRRSEKKGFYAPADMFDNGMVFNKYATKYDAERTFCVTDEQAKAAMDTMKNKENEQYWLYNNNCIDAVEEALDAADIECPFFGFGIISNPDSLYRWVVDGGGAKDSYK